MNFFNRFAEKKETNILEFLHSIFEILEERKVFFLIVDGLGKENLHLNEFKVFSCKTLFPSSTPTFFYTFHSLLPPKQHGFLEWYMRFKGKVITIPPWKTIDGRILKLGKDVRRKDVFPFKSLSEKLNKKGFSSVYYTPYPNSLFTKTTSKKAEVVGIDFLSQVFPLKNADFTFIYWPSIDLILHERFKDESFYAEIKMIKYFIKMLKKRIPKKSILFVFGDHGLTKVEKHFLLPSINNSFPVGGERVAFYKGIEKEKVERKIKKRKIPANIFYLNELKDFEGKINKRCYKNFGEVVVIAKRGIGFKYGFEIKRGKKVWDLGAHGGYTKEEKNLKIWFYEKN